MKTKKLSKKLELNKKTIARLDTEQLGQVQGGVEQRTIGFTTCTTCIIMNTFCQLSSCCNPTTIG